MAREFKGMEIYIHVNREQFYKQMLPCQETSFLSIKVKETDTN